MNRASVLAVVVRRRPQRHLSISTDARLCSPVSQGHDRRRMNETEERHSQLAMPALSTNETCSRGGCATTSLPKGMPNLSGRSVRLRDPVTNMGSLGRLKPATNQGHSRHIPATRTFTPPPVRQAFFPASYSSRPESVGTSVGILCVTAREGRRTQRRLSHGNGWPGSVVEQLMPGP